MFLTLLLACPSPTPVVVPPTPELPAWLATPVDATSSAPIREVPDTPASAAVPSGSDVFVDDAGESTLLDPWFRGTPLDAVLGDLHAATPWQGGHLLATDAGPRLWDGGLTPVDLGGLTGIDTLLDDGDSLWIADDDGVHVLVGSTLSALTAGGEATSGIVQGPSDGLFWTHQGAWVLGFALEGGVPVLRESAELFGPVTDLAGSHTDLIALVDGWMVAHSDDGWTRLDPGRPVRELRGDGRTSVVWARTDDGWLLRGTEGWTDLEDQGTPNGSPDALGRMWFSTTDGAVRVSHTHHVTFLSPPDGPVVLPTPLAVAVSLTEDLGDVTASLHGSDDSVTPLPVVDEDGRFTIELDPDAHPAGSYTVVVEASYDGEVVREEHALQLGAFVPTWSGFVQPIFQDRCYACHAGAVAPDLQTLEAWRDGLDTILDNVGAVPPIMPPDPTDALSPVELDLLDAWREAGFPQ